MKKFHINKDGNPNICTAVKNSCPFGGENEHYSSEKEAREAFENSFRKDTFAVHQKPDIVSAEMSRNYAIYSYLNDHLHNSSNFMEPEEIAYYSSPAGRLELEIRINSFSKNADPSHNRFLKVKEIIDSKDFTPEIENFDNEEIKQRIESGYRELYSTKEIKREKDIKERTRDGDLPLALIDSSHKWLSKLTTKEQEAISRMTSNGFILAQKAIGINESFNYSGLIDEDKIYSEYSDYDEAEEKIEEEKERIDKEFLSIVNSALSKAPKSIKPIFTYRGTTFSEVRDLINDKHTDQSTLMKSIIKGTYNSRISEDSRMAKIPLSSTAVSGITAKFGITPTDDYKIVLEISSRTMASPINVSAWSAGEGEFLTNPHSSYKVTGGKIVKRKDNADIFVLKLEEE